MQFMRKYGAKMFFAIACLLFVASLAFSAFSLARYVTDSEHNNGAGAAAIGCEFRVDNGGLGAFINAPYMQQVAGNTRPVRMNSWSESMLIVTNNGRAGLVYEYSFVFYMPQGFAECAMFQLLELEENGATQESAPSRLHAAKKASKLYHIESAPEGSAPAVRNIVEAQETADGVAVENEYQSLINEGNEIVLSASTAVLSEEEQRGVAKRTFATYYPAAGTDTVDRFVCPVGMEQSIGFRYYRMTINISRTAKEYRLKEGESQSFLLRLVLLNRLDSALVDVAWNSADYWQTDESGNFTVPKAQPQAAGDYLCRWATDDSGKPVLDGGGKPQLEAAEKNADGTVTAYRTIKVGTCVGITSPCRMSAVFTQVTA